MNRRELVEHREQLREGKRWLDTMLSKTEKLLGMVESKLAAGDALSGSSSAPPTSGPRQGEDWEFEERERQRQREFQRLEDEAQRDRQEKAQRDKERTKPSPATTHALGREEFLFDRGRPRDAQPLAPAKTEERGRDLLLARRPAASPTASTNGHRAGSNGAAPAGKWDAEREREREREREAAVSLTSVALPRRGEQSRLGRGLWAFDSSRTNI